MREYNIECVLIASIMFSKLRLEFQFRTIALDRADQSRLSSYSGVDPYATWGPKQSSARRSRDQLCGSTVVVVVHMCPVPVHTTISFNELF
jgi:hypothetical protein